MEQYSLYVNFLKLNYRLDFNQNSNKLFCWNGEADYLHRNAKDLYQQKSGKRKTIGLTQHDFKTSIKLQ